MAQIITTSLVISFSGEGAYGAGGGMLRAEVDARPEGLNKGTTSFYKGDSPGFLVYKSLGVTISKMVASDGKTYGTSDFIIDREEWLVFANTNQASLAYPPIGSVGLSHLKGVSSANLRVEGGVVLAKIPVVATCKAKYKTKAWGYRLSGASGNGPVVVVIMGDV